MTNEASDAINGVSDGTNETSDEAFEASVVTNQASFMANEVSVAIKEASEMTACTPKTIKKATFTSFAASTGQNATAFQSSGMNFTGILSFAA